uniref:Uncharacterized protein MANES_10G068400 n=2 Tax=Rhizophora mucronata TaxID=61149 RepID=A0A2P2M8K2_RHIMU
MGVGLEEAPIPPIHQHPGKEQQAAGVGILLQIMMLVLSFVLGHVLRRHKFYYLPEASASLLIGLTVGGLANISDTETSIRAWFNFHEEFFFLFLLPPIIFQSGFSLSPVSTSHSHLLCLYSQICMKLNVFFTTYLIVVHFYRSPFLITLEP